MTTKQEQLAQEVAKAVGAGKVASLETVDFNDTDHPKTCLEVDFPILPINKIATIEGKGSGALKPIYQTSKWWARRRSNVFRSLLIAAATKAPEDKSYSAKLVWDNYYANHQKKGTFKNLKVADIFMGGGTTLVEGARLGMQMVGNDLNPVAWFVVKQELSKVDPSEIKRLLADVEAEVKPKIMPYYYCDGPDGEKGKWTHVATRRLMPTDFDPLSIPKEQRCEYSYEGPEILYTFWSKHGPCHVTGCDHRTPIMTSPVMAAKTCSVKYWEYSCIKCGGEFHVEEAPARLAPDVPLYVSPTEYSFSVLDKKKGIVCPHCDSISMVNLGKGKKKKIELSLLVHPQWLAGSPKQDVNGQPFGGSAQDDSVSSARWNDERAKNLRLLEVRGPLPEEVICPETGRTFDSGKQGGTATKTSSYTCSSCGTEQSMLDGIRKISKTAPVAGYAAQCYSKQLDLTGAVLGGKFFCPFDSALSRQYSMACAEWESRKDADLAGYWPRSKTLKGQESTRLLNHFYSEWWMLFNPRQLLVHAQLLKAILTVGSYSWDSREYLLSAFQQYLRNQCMFCFWNMQRALEPMFSNNDFAPKASVVENSCFSGMGRGDFLSCANKALESLSWSQTPWEIACSENDGHSEKVTTGDPVLHDSVTLNRGSATDLDFILTSTIDLVITDPPFGNLLQYSELSDFFYVWLRLALQSKYPDVFSTDLTPKSLEVVSNKAREPEDPDGFYQRLLTQSWREAHRILKPGGLLAFTFHHSEDDPWVAVLESLFDAGFYLEATYPIRSDESKGENSEFGSKTIEYDIIHVCRKRTKEPEPVSWGRMRREVLADVRQLQELLENHAKAGLPAADIQVIRRGKALEYFSRHYGKVYVDEGRTISVKDALVGINQLIDEDADKSKEPPPVNAEPITRQFLRTFGTATEMKRDQLQKFLKGSITTPDEFEQRGWCSEKSKVFTRVNPLDFARDWSGKHKRRLTSDLDQALVLIGACFDGSGINASDTLKNENFKPHVALKPLLEWLHKNGPDQASRNAASRAVSIYNGWAATQAVKPTQGTLFEEYEL
jgi:putative DNA methylase